MPLAAVRKIVLGRFPSFERIAEVIPKVVAGHLSWRESVVLEAAMDHLAAQGVTAIPLHDALIVPVSAVEEAKRELEDAFMKQLKVKAASSSGNSATGPTPGATVQGIRFYVVFTLSWQPFIRMPGEAIRTFRASNSNVENCPVPQAALTNESCHIKNNVVAFQAPADTFMTVFMFDQVARAALSLPVGWFDVCLQRDEGAGVRQDHVMIARVAGPPVGSFSVRRGSRGRFRVVHMSELHQAEDRAESGPYRTVEAAVEAIRTDIRLQLDAWGVMPVAEAA